MKLTIQVGTIIGIGTSTGLPGTKHT